MHGWPLVGPTPQAFAAPHVQLGRADGGGIKPGLGFCLPCMTRYHAFQVVHFRFCGGNIQNKKPNLTKIEDVFVLRAFSLLEVVSINAWLMTVRIFSPCRSKFHGEVKIIAENELVADFIVYEFQADK